MIEGLIRSYAAITCSNIGESASKRLPVRRRIRDVDAPRSGLGDADLHAPDAGELGTSGVARMQRELAHE